MTHPIAVLGVPSSIGSHYAGQEKAPSALRRAGLIDRLRERGENVVDVGDLPLRIYRPRSALRGAQNLPGVVENCREVSRRVDNLLGEGFFPLVIGGDCTITLGVLAAFRRHVDRLGLMYFDGDVDLGTPEASRSGILDAMGVAHAVGRGASELSRIGGETRLLDEERIALVGFEPADLDERMTREPEQSPMLRFSAPEVAARAIPAAEEACAQLGARSDRFLLHFDVDVIDSSDCPLANFPHQRQGLSLSDAFACLRVFLSDSKVGGLVLTELNPDHDGDGTLVQEFIDLLVDAFSRSGR